MDVTKQDGTVIVSMTENESKLIMQSLMRTSSSGEVLTKSIELEEKLSRIMGKTYEDSEIDLIIEARHKTGKEWPFVTTDVVKLSLVKEEDGIKIICVGKAIKTYKTITHFLDRWNVEERTLNKLITLFESKSKYLVLTEFIIHCTCGHSYNNTQLVKVKELYHCPHCDKQVTSIGVKQ